MNLNTMILIIYSYFIKNFIELNYLFFILIFVLKFDK